MVKESAVVDAFVRYEIATSDKYVQIWSSQLRMCTALVALCAFGLLQTNLCPVDAQDGSAHVGFVCR